MLTTLYIKFTLVKDKNTDKPIIISTWQSIYKFPKRYFDDIDCVIGDEAHLFKSKSLTGIMTKLHNAKYGFGFTGTLDGSKTHKWVLEGLFGKCEQVTKTDDLIKEGYLSNFRIKSYFVNMLLSILNHIKMK